MVGMLTWVRDIIGDIIRAAHSIDLLRFYWESTRTGALYEFVPLTVGWGSVLLCTLDGRPLLGVQVSYGSVVVWCGPLFWSSYRD